MSFGQGVRADRPFDAAIPEPVSAILGISAFYHDSAAALLIDGAVFAAAQEDRFTRRKHDHAFPSMRSGIASTRRR